MDEESKVIFSIKDHFNNRPFKAAKLEGLRNNRMVSVSPAVLSFIEAEMRDTPQKDIKEFINYYSNALLNPDKTIFECFFDTIIFAYELKCRTQFVPLGDLKIHLVEVASKVKSELGGLMRKMLLTDIFADYIAKVIQKLPINKSSNSGFNFTAITRNKNQQPVAAQNCQNLQKRPTCICTDPKEITVKDKYSFLCSHCQNLFHTVCFRKSSYSLCCSYCFLEKMIPIKKVISTVYMGLMKKNMKKHTATFNAPQLAQYQRLQVRCMRLKEKAHDKCLFPDIAEIFINNHKVKQFEALNKQCSLKFRKDEPFILNKMDYFQGQENILVLHQNYQNQRGLRYESQSHIFAIFVVENYNIQSLIKDIKGENVLGFSQSKRILTQSFQLGKGDDDVSCQLFKIPLICPLTAIKIDIPVRGTFCTHFQCFDLKNYLFLTSTSQNPRWKCPLCSNLCYQLQIDPIIQHILNQTKGNQKIQQVLFFSDENYAAVIEESLQQKKSVNTLNIPQKETKYRLPPPLEEQAFKSQFQVPANAQVIDLDLD